VVGELEGNANLNSSESVIYYILQRHVKCIYLFSDGNEGKLCVLVQPGQVHQEHKACHNGEHPHSKQRAICNPCIMRDSQSPHHKEEHTSYQVDDELQDRHIAPQQVGHQDSWHNDGKPNDCSLAKECVIHRAKSKCRMIWTTKPDYEQKNNNTHLQQEHG